MLAAVADPTTSLGVMGPLGASTTIEKVAINAVMAGCEPDHMPIVVATLRALLRPEYDLSEAQSTTHSTSPLVVVSGPLARACGIAGGFGALGPGHRANASIGRAVRLCLMNIGGAKPGVSDMALLGHPGKFTMCLAENVAESPWEPCSVAAGFDPLDSVVTVIGVEGPHSVVFVDDADDADSPQRLLRVVARAIANPGSNNAFFRTGSVAVALNPEHAAVLARAGLGRADVQRELHRLATNRRGDLRRLNPAFAGPAVRTTSSERCRHPTTSSCSSPAAAGCTRRCSRRGRPAPTPTRSSTSASRPTRPAPFPASAEAFGLLERSATSSRMMMTGDDRACSAAKGAPWTSSSRWCSSPSRMWTAPRPSTPIMSASSSTTITP